MVDGSAGEGTSDPCTNLGGLFSGLRIGENLDHNADEVDNQVAVEGVLLGEKVARQNALTIGDSDEDEESGSEDLEDDSEEDMDWESEDLEEGSDAEDEFLGEEIEQELFDIGAEGISERDKSILRAFAYKMKTHGTNEAFDALRFAFPRDDLPNLKKAKARVDFLAGLKPIDYHCCPKSCCAFLGPHENLDVCPYCNSPRYGPSGKPLKKYSYVPVIPRLVAYLGDLEMAKKMRYRAHEHDHQPDVINDVFNSILYRDLLNQKVTINDTELRHNHFSDPRDIALGLSTDGFSPFRRRKTT
ncbi:hypothetical protein HYDPIDRAFT_124259, partial [Hydnomerulius pinastri MD-312]